MDTQRPQEGTGRVSQGPRRQTGRSLRAGQTGPEWALLLGAILFVAVVAVALVGLWSSDSDRAKIERASAYWSGEAKPLRVTGWSLKAEEPDNVYAQITLSFYNPSAERISIRRLTLSPGNFRLAYDTSGGSLGASDNLNWTLLPGDRAALMLEQPAEEASEMVLPSYALNLTIGYDGAFEGQQQAGSYPLAGRRQPI